MRHTACGFDQQVAPGLRQVVPSIIVAPVGTQTIFTYIWRQFEQGSLGLGMAFVTILIATVFPLVLLSLLGNVP